MPVSPSCKNYEMNLAGTGQQNSYPRSCITCGFTGRCAYDIKRATNSAIEERYYVGYKQDMLAAEKRNEFKYAVLYSDTIHHEGDQRSRDYPGHGYPAWTETIEKIQTFKSEDELKEWILKNNSGYSRKTFTAIRYQQLSVSTEVKVNLI